MDADATYPVPAIKEMVELLDENDLVRGIRDSEPESMPIVNRFGNWLFNKLLALSHGLEGSDHLSGLYAMRRSAAVRLGTEAQGFDIETEIGIKAQARGLRQATVPISYLPRVGQKKLNPWKDGLRILGRVIVLLLIYNPTLTFIVPGLVLMAISVTGAILLSNGPVSPFFLGLDNNSFIVAALGVLAAFQLTIFGVAAALYGVEAGKRAALVAAPGDLRPLPPGRRPSRPAADDAVRSPSWFSSRSSGRGTTRSRTLRRWCCPRASWCSGCRCSRRRSSSRSSAAGSAGSPRKAPRGRRLRCLGRSRQLQRRRLARPLPRRPSRRTQTMRSRRSLSSTTPPPTAATRSRRQAAERHDSVRLLRSPTNRGYAGAVNLALTEARGTYLAVLNMDVVVGAGWLDPLIAFLEATPDAGAVCPLIVLESDPGQDQRRGTEHPRHRTRLQPLAGGAPRARRQPNRFGSVACTAPPS